MTKNLRLMMMSMLMLIAGMTMAQRTVTIDFDNDYAALFPQLAGVSSSDSHDGDFTETTVSTEVDGVTVIVAPAEDAKTPSRIWTSAPRLRMYSGSFSVTGLNITKIEFTGHNSNFNLTPLTGTLDGKTWTGEASNLVVFNVDKNTQINKIVVTLGEGDDPGDDDDEFEIEYESGTMTETANQLLFDFKATEVNTGTSITGQMEFNFTDNLCTSATTKFVFPTAEQAQLAYQSIQDEADEEGFDEVTINGATIVATMTSRFQGFTKAMVKVMLKMIMDDETLGTGSFEKPYTPVEANIFGKMMLEPGETTPEVFIKGVVSSITYPFDEQHGTATFYISEDGTASDQFLVYSTYYLENKSWVEGYDQIEEGDEVIIYGKMTNYNGTIETASRQSYIYSLNGKTEAGDAPEPQVKLVNVAEALLIIDALEDGKTTSETYQVKGIVVGAPDFQRKSDGSLYGNVNLDMADTTDGAKLTVFRAKSFENESFTEETISLIKEGDEVVFEGKLQKYVRNDETTPELTGGKLISVNGQGNSISTITIDAQQQHVYNLQGQRVAQPTKGLYIINGKKVLVK